MIGTPAQDEPLEEILETQESVDYVRKLAERPRADLAEKYPATESRGITLLYKMLEFNPSKRPTAEEALQDPYFDDIRLPEQERFEIADIKMPVDDEGRSNLSMDELKRMVIEEITKLDSDKFDFADDYEEECEDY